MKRTLYILYILMVLTACSDHDWLDIGSADAGDKIQVGGLVTSPLEISVSENATRALHVQDAEEVPWLIGPLKEGLDVTYGKVTDDPAKKNERVALLQLQAATNGTDPYQKDPDTGWAIYTFQYKGTNPAKDAIWYDNGEHYFEGMFVPDNLRYGNGVSGDGRAELSSVNTTSAPNITTDQSSATNYSYLEHYLAMPADTKIHATVGRVKLPFYHRLSRVIAYILIDPAMQLDPAHPDVTLKGYSKDSEGKDNPATTSIRFCNVNVLTGVNDKQPADAAHTHELTPQWASMRKVIPHFEAEEGSMVQNTTGAFEEKDADFYMFYDDKTQEYFFPTMGKWADYYTKYKSATDQQLEEAKVTRTNYGRVPVYDLIVRPTYTAKNTVMYDEHNASDQSLSDAEKSALVDMKNKIDFELTLSNGLIYTKEFEFDLNANEQTVVYLRISRESVDYNASGSEIWVNRQKDDDWYGIDNQLGHSLSLAGSSWQRAYTYNATVSGDKVTDGGFYNETTTVGEDGTVGQYVTLATWKKKFAQAYEGGECHGDYFILTNNITIDAKSLPDKFVFTGHLDARGHTITIENAGAQWTEYVETTDYNISPLYSDQSGTEYNLPTLYTKVHHDAVYYTDVDDYNNDHDPDIDADAFANLDESAKIKIAASDEFPIATPSLATVMAVAAGTYFVYEGGEYKPFTKPTTLYKKVDHTSGSALFAGLNGAYTTTVEGEANVHTEGGIKVPYTNGTTGWRAEVINLIVKGNLFADEVYTPDATTRTGYDVSKVSGNVDNCYDGVSGDKKVPNHTPALFKY